MTNLWKETIDVLRANGKSFKDVILIYGDDYQITKDNFEKVAKATNFDSGYGAQKVAKDLVISGNGFVMQRSEYDGSEWWEFTNVECGTKIVKEVILLAGGMWSTLSEINENKQKEELE